MLDHASEAVSMARGRTRGDLDSDRQFNLAMVRLLEVVGEAATRLSPDFWTDIRQFSGSTLWACETA